MRLIGVAAPEEAAAKEFLSAFLGQTVLLESDPAHPDDRRLQRYVWVSDTAGLPVMANDLLMEQGLASYEASGTTGRFDALIAAVNRLPSSGLESRDQPPPMRVEPNATSPVELTGADRAYLAELARYRDNLNLGLQFYDLHMTAPTFDAEFSGQLGIMILGWAVFYDGLVKLEPTPQFADLHARLLAAFEPFDTLAHQIEPALDQMLAGETPEQQFAGFDYDVMTATVAAARPELEQVHVGNRCCAGSRGYRNRKRGDPMTALPEARGTSGMAASAISWRTVIYALLALAFLGVAFGLAAIGLDALNDLLARGFASIGSPAR